MVEYSKRLRKAVSDSPLTPDGMADPGASVRPILSVQAAKLKIMAAEHVEQLSTSSVGMAEMARKETTNVAEWREDDLEERLKHRRLLEEKFDELIKAVKGVEAAAGRGSLVAGGGGGGGDDKKKKKRRQTPRRGGRFGRLGRIFAGVGGVVGGALSRIPVRAIVGGLARGAASLLPVMASFVPFDKLSGGIKDLAGRMSGLTSSLGLTRSSVDELPKNMEKQQKPLLSSLRSFVRKIISPKVVNPNPTIQPRVVNPNPTIQPRVVNPNPVIEPKVIQPKPVAPVIQPRVVNAAPVIEPRVVNARPLIEPRVVNPNPTIQPRVVNAAPLIEPRVVNPNPTIKPNVITPTIEPRVVNPTIKPNVITPTIEPRVVNPTITARTVTPVIEPKVITPTIKPHVITPTIRPNVVVPTIEPRVVTPTIKPNVITPTITAKTPVIEPKIVNPTIRPHVITPTVRPNVVVPTIRPNVITPTITPKVTTPVIEPKVINPTVRPRVVQPTITIEPKVTKPTITIEPKVTNPRPLIEPRVVNANPVIEPKIVNPNPTIKPSVINANPLIEPKVVAPEVKVPTRNFRLPLINVGAERFRLPAINVPPSLFRLPSIDLRSMLGLKPAGAPAGAGAGAGASAGSTGGKVNPAALGTLQPAAPAAAYKMPKVTGVAPPLAALPEPKPIAAGMTARVQPQSKAGQAKQYLRNLKTKADKFVTTSPKLRRIFKALGPLGWLMAGYHYGSQLLNVTQAHDAGAITDEEYKVQVGAIVGSALGGVAGAYFLGKVAAAGGLAVGGPVGALVAGLAGGTIGYFAGDALGHKIGKYAVSVALSEEERMRSPTAMAALSNAPTPALTDYAAKTSPYQSPMAHMLGMARPAPEAAPEMPRTPPVVPATATPQINIDPVNPAAMSTSGMTDMASSSGQMPQPAMGQTSGQQAGTASMPSSSVDVDDIPLVLGGGGLAVFATPGA